MKTFHPSHSPKDCQIRWATDAGFTLAIAEYLWILNIENFKMVALVSASQCFPTVILETAVEGSSGFPWRSQSWHSNLLTWLLLNRCSFHFLAPVVWIISAGRWNKLASGQHRLSEKHNGFAKCNYMYIQKKNYAVLILCKMEKSVLELVILGADRRPCFWGVITTHALAVRRVVYKVFWWVHVHKLILLLKTNWTAYGYKLDADIPDSLKHNTRLCLHKLVVTGYNNICWNCYSFVCFNNNCSETN